jgi:hypothetical protein
MYMNWIYANNLRNTTLNSMQSFIQQHINVCQREAPPQYPFRPITEHQSNAVGEFHQHPNSSQIM